MMWQPIETAPKDGTIVFLFSNGETVRGSFRVDDGFTGHDFPEWLDDSFDDWTTGYSARPLTPTHWMPLPNPPSP